MEGDEPAPRLPLRTCERLVGLGLGATLVGLIAADLVHDFAESKLGLPLVLAFLVPVLALHELAHVAAARLVGWRLDEVTIGFGRELSRFALGQIRVSVRSLPIEAEVSPMASSLESARLKRALIHLAGPLSGVLVIAACGFGSSWRWPTPSSPFEHVCLASLALAAGFCTLSALVPHRAGGRSSDGFVLASCCFGTANHLQRELSAPFWRANRRLLLAEQPAAALEVARAGLARFDAPRLAGSIAVSLAALGQVEQAFARLEALGPPDERPAPVRASLLCAAGWAVLFARDASLLHEAERAVRQALELDPDDCLAEVLLGRICLERSDPAAAYIHLVRAYQRTRELDLEAQCVAYLAITARALRGHGRAEMASYAARFAAAAISRSTPPELRERVLECFGRA